MKYRVVTTCHEKGWKTYGRRMAKSFDRFWPPAVKLTVYAEGFKPDVPCEVRELPRWVGEFKARNAGDPKKSGLIDGRGYNLLFDARRFSHKVGAVTDAIDTYTDCETLIWVDADVVTHALVSLQFIDQLWGGDLNGEGEPGIAWLNRVHKYPECGFVMYDLDHEKVQTLAKVWRSLYISDHVFNLEHWTDCHTLEACVKRLEIPTVSLSGGYTNVGHPFVNGPLGTVMDHLKGDRKHLGHSRRHDLRTRRSEPYWKGIR